MYNFGDQDQFHNVKKMINLVVKVFSLLVLRDQHASLSYVVSVYNYYPIHKHEMVWDDVNRTNRQNWTGSQRIATKKVQKCLKDLYKKN